MTRGAWRVAALAATVLATACGGGAPAPGAATPPAPAASVDASRVAQIDASNFDSVVLGGARPSLVEFHSPT